MLRLPSSVLMHGHLIAGIISRVQVYALVPRKSRIVHAMDRAKFSADASMNLLVSCSLATCLRPDSLQPHSAPITFCSSYSPSCLVHLSSSSTAHLTSPHDQLQVPLISGGQCDKDSGDSKAEVARLNERDLG